MKIKEILSEKINLAVTDKNFHAEKTVTLPSGTFKLVANGSHDILRVPEFIILVFNENDERVGYFRFVVHGYDPERRNIFGFRVKTKEEDQYIVGGNVSVSRDYQKKGIATAVYQFVKELGNDIKPSGTQTDAGKNMWKSFNR
jgi:hypothetical protein